MLNLEKVLAQVKSWSKEVGKIQLKKMNSDIEINIKGDEIDLVTEVDELSEKLLIEKIKDSYPEHSILSEESGVDRKESDYLWVIDPIDGTTNYASGFFAFCISIALQFKGETVLGLVYVPTLNYMYTAIKGEGAFLNDNKIKVGNAKCLRESVLATGFPYDRASDPDNNVDNFNKIVTKLRGIRRTGSAAFDLCNVAAGVFDGYWEGKLNLWDIGAGLLIIKEAGGKVMFDEKEKGITVIVGNKDIVDILNQELKLID
ncbi:inositol monophosphatase family protein [Orenia marismortui]|uniref:Inositol-1-monophosphatase n=1 Tax=Orenia marismortui TaxID=46469 RepID=A0A4R8H3G1_9FIRM|nr:inositol monophosphatase family protein [Orenia marismortui]TDX49062.1 myo-inositol-1(or 4)-monophosphatase [Orenia marismortui]